MQLKLDDDFLNQLTKNIRLIYKEAVEVARRDAGIDKKYLNIPEALEYTGVSRNTFTKNFIDGGLPTYQVEGKTYVKKSEINEFIESHKI